MLGNGALNTYMPAISVARVYYAWGFRILLARDPWRALGLLPVGALRELYTAARAGRC